MSELLVRREAVARVGERQNDVVEQDAVCHASGCWTFVTFSSRYVFDRVLVLVERVTVELFVEGDRKPTRTPSEIARTTVRQVAVEVDRRVKPFWVLVGDEVLRHEMRETAGVLFPIGFQKTNTNMPVLVWTWIDGSLGLHVDDVALIADGVLGELFELRPFELHRYLSGVVGNLPTLSHQLCSEVMNS